MAAPQGPPPYSAPAQPTPVGPQANVPIVVLQNNLGPEPTRTTCRSCQQETTTRVTKRATMKTHLIALLLCVIGCWPCVCIPYCMDSCLSSHHYCSHCNTYMGSHRP